MNEIVQQRATNAPFGKPWSAAVMRETRDLAGWRHVEPELVGQCKSVPTRREREGPRRAGGHNVAHAVERRLSTPTALAGDRAMTGQAECVFCAIVAGRTPAGVVLDEPDFLGFLDVRPVFKGHVLLVPREHVPTLPDLPARLRDGFLEAAQRVAAAMVEALGAQGSFVAVNNTVSQSVPHLHLHVVPRTKGDGLRGFFWPRTRYEGAEDRDRFVALLRAALE